MKKKILFIYIFFVFVSWVWGNNVTADIQSEDGFIFPKSYAEKMGKVETVMGFNTKYLPRYFQSPVDFINVIYNMDFHFKTKFYTSKDSPYTTTPINVAYDFYLGKNEIGEEVAPDYAMVMVPGSAGSYFKYGEYMYDMEQATKQKIAFFMMDPRGQGFSTWFNPKGVDGFNGLYVDRFTNYINDLKYFFSFIVKPKVAALEMRYKKKIPIFVYGHSLGGGIVARYLEIFPYDFTGAILSSPAIQALNWTTRNLAFWPIYAIVLHGGGPEYVPFGKSLHLPLNFNSIFCNTSCERRWYYWQKISDPSFFDNKTLIHPKSGGEVLRMGFPTYWWTFQLIEGTNPIAEKVNASKVRVPYIILKAGMEDLVSNDAMTKFIANTPEGLGKLHSFPSARHDIMLEQDFIRNRSINIIISFMKEHSAKKKTFMDYVLTPFNYLYRHFSF